MFSDVFGFDSARHFEFADQLAQGLGVEDTAVVIPDVFRGSPCMQPFSFLPLGFTAPGMIWRAKFRYHKRYMNGIVKNLIMPWLKTATSLTINLEGEKKEAPKEDTENTTEEKEENKKDEAKATTQKEEDENATRTTPQDTSTTLEREVEFSTVGFCFGAWVIGTTVFPAALVHHDVNITSLLVALARALHPGVAPIMVVTAPKTTWDEKTAGK